MKLAVADRTETVGERAYHLCERLWGFPRSLTGDGVRDTLDVLGEVTPLEVQEVPSGTEVYDWTVPPEWSVNEAYIETLQGERLVSWQDNPLHLMGYSVSVSGDYLWQELLDHLHVGERPGEIPYRTSYYERDWAFCVTPEQFQALSNYGALVVEVDAKLDPYGSLTYADAGIEGETDREYLLSTYCCHPAMANDGLSGLVVATLLFEKLREYGPRHSWRLVVAPETIGTLAYLSEHEAEMKQVDGGYVVTTCGGPGPLGYKTSFEGDHDVDRAAGLALPTGYEHYSFRPTGSDERQYASPGFRIPTGTITKDKYHEYPEYHTSRDNLDLISPGGLRASFDAYWAAIMALERNVTYRRTEPHGEYKLGDHGLYPEKGKARGERGDVSKLDAARWLMFACDGETGLLDVAWETGVPMELLWETGERMRECGLLEVVG